MAKNQKFGPLRTRSLPVPTDRLSGQAVIVGAQIGVLLTDEGKGGNADGFATVALDGQFKLNVTTTTTLAIGAPVYIITSTNVLTTTSNSAANPLFGFAAEAKGSAAADILVELALV